MALSIVINLGMLFVGIILGFLVTCICGIAKTYSEDEIFKENQNSV